MAAKKKYKKLTNAEKKINKDIKARLIEQGVLPPRKTPLNRRKFAQEIDKELQGCSIYELAYAISFMRPTGEHKIKITDEEVGVLKVCKMAIEYRKYADKRKKEDPDAKITVGDIYDNVIKPIRDL
ncbi:MAG: addiction module toxin RelE [Anaerovorax sp.]|nr:addiction module toxin RelE [Anaerovorax sp.]